MAEPTMTPQEFEAIQNANREQPKVIHQTVTAVREITKFIVKSTPGFVDALATLIICACYFFFTGLAIVFRSPLPKEWLKIGSELNSRRVARKVASQNPENPVNQPSVTDIKDKQRFRVVDLETKRDINPIRV